MHDSPNVKQCDSHTEMEIPTVKADEPMLAKDTSSCWVKVNVNDATRAEDLKYWDDLFGIGKTDNEWADETSTLMALNVTDAPPEFFPLSLPSSGIQQKYQPIELAFCIHKADEILTKIRELIADKSFKYTDEIRHAPRKGVWTRA